MDSRNLRTILAALAIGTAASIAYGQEPAGSEQIGPYSATGSFELGVRGVKVDGDDDKYRSDLNYSPGFKFNDSSLLLRTDPGEGKLFDSLLVHVTGWDADPYGYLKVDVGKLDAYEFDCTVRRSSYYNSLRNLALKQHNDDTRHTLGDFNLTILPTYKPFRLNLGYAFDHRTGPTTTTYDYSRDEFPLFQPWRSHSDTYTIGFDSSLDKVDINFTAGFRHFKDDPFFRTEGVEQGNDGAAVPTVLNSLYRDLPSRGQVNFTRINVHTFLNNMLDITGRFIYSHSKTDSTLFETVNGVDFSNSVIDYGQSSSVAHSERPDVIADIGVTVLATEQMRISNTFRYNWFKIEGDDALNEQLYGPSIGARISDTVFERLTKYRLFSDTIELDYEFHPRITAHVGYRYTDRSTDFRVLDRNPNSTEEVEPEIEDFDNRTNTFIFGLFARPLKERWSIYFDFEKGENDNVFTRVANYDYTSIRLRNRISITDKISLNLSAISKTNDNPATTEDIPPVDFGTHAESRIFSASGDWTPNQKFSLSSGYTHSRITSDATILFFFNFQPKQGLSQYFTRDNFAYLNVNAQLAPRVSLYAAYQFHDDNAAGDRRPESESVLIASYPYRYQTPEIRLSFKLHDHIDAVLGYQYYKYEETFRQLDPAHPVPRQNYSAQLPYGSLRFTF